MNEEPKFEYTPEENAVRWKLEDVSKARRKCEEAHAAYLAAAEAVNQAQEAVQEAFKALRKERA
jgi:hypothetical protein